MPAAPGGGAPSPPCALSNQITISGENIVQDELQNSSSAAGSDSEPCSKALEKGSLLL